MDWEQIDSIKTAIRDVIGDSEYRFGIVITALAMLKAELQCEADSIENPGKIGKNWLSMKEVRKLKKISLE